MDQLAFKYNSLSPYNYVANNPLLYIDPDGREIKIHREKSNDGKVTIVITITGKLLNDSSTKYTQEQLDAYAERITNSLTSAFTNSGDNVSFESKVNISVANSNEDISKSDHVFRIVDQGKIPDGKGNFRPKGVLGRAKGGENFIYLSNHFLDRKEDLKGTYKNTGKTSNGQGTLERTSAHEMGHSTGLPHPALNTQDGNLMHQTKQRNTGKKLTQSQILRIEKLYKAKKLNRGKQKY